MDMKRAFGGILLILGIIGIIWGAYAFLMGGDGVAVGQYTAAVPFIVGLIFFFGGMSLVKSTRDRAR